jgi:hypothetical protein
VAILGVFASGRLSSPVQAECDPEGGPAVTTDKQEYLPAEIAQIEGCGFDAYEGLSLSLTVTEPDAYIFSDTVTITSAGFLYNYTVPNKQGLFKVEIWDGPTLLATTSFLDDHHVDPEVLNFVAIESGSNPPNQIFQFIGPTSCGSGTVTDNRTWISESPTSFPSSGPPWVAGPGSNEHIDVTVSIDITGLTVGSYSGTVTVDGSGSGCDSVRNVTINLRVIKPNPKLPASCGIDIVLVIDSSGSISSSELTAQKNAFIDFVGAFLPGTNAEIAIVEFDTSAFVRQTFTTNVSSLTTAINNTVSGGNTNWDDALFDSRSLFPHRGGFPDLIVMGSDGNPNYRRGHLSQGKESVTESAAMTAAVAESDAAKNSGIRIITLGIGNDLDTSNLMAISGVNISPPASITANTDAITTSFDTLADTLADLADSLCVTPTPTPTKTNTPTNTPTKTNTPTNTPTKTNTPTNTPVPPTATPTPTATNTPTNTPTDTPVPPTATHADQHPGAADGDADTDGYQHADEHTDQYAGAADRYTDANGHEHADEYTDQHAGAADGYPDADEHTDEHAGAADGYPDADEHTDEHAGAADGNPDADEHTDQHAGATDGDTNADQDEYAGAADGDADTDEHPCTANGNAAWSGDTG